MAGFNDRVGGGSSPGGTGTGTGRDTNSQTPATVTTARKRTTRGKGDLLCTAGRPSRPGQSLESVATSSQFGSPLARFETGVAASEL